MPAVKRTFVEDLFKKRAVLIRYLRCWERELDQTSLTPHQRRQIEDDIETIRAIDEDLLRLEHLLAQGPVSHDRDDNDKIREQVVSYLIAAGGMVPATELCTALGIDDVKLRNCMRALKSTGRVLAAAGRYGIAQPHSGADAAGEERRQ